MADRGRSEGWVKIVKIFSHARFTRNFASGNEQGGGDERKAALTTRVKVRLLVPKSSVALLDVEVKSLSYNR